jgi:hypothetical protein
MATLEKSSLPPPAEKEGEEVDEDAPYGYKADGTPKKRPGRPAGASGGTRKATGTSVAKLKELKEPLAERLVEYLGPPIGFASPLALGVLDDRADKTADALINLAIKRPRIRKIVEGLVEGSSTVDLALTAVGIMVAISVDMQRSRPDTMVANYFDIPRIWEETYGEEVQQRQDIANAQGLMNEI